MLGIPTSKENEKMAQTAKMARILAVIIGVIVMILSVVRVFPLSNEGLVIAAFLTCWGLDALI